MKKVLSIVLSIVMVLCMMPAMAFAGTADFTDAADIEYAEAVDVLYAAGIIDGMPDGSFGPNGNVTREQAAKLIATVLLGDKAEKLATDVAPFSDVAADRWSAGYIAYGVEKGILAGVGNGAFDPTGDVTALQLAKMLLIVQGYDATIEGLTGGQWAVNTSELAETNELFAGNDAVLVNNAASREEAALYILNTLVADVVKYDDKGTNVTLPDGTTIVSGASNAEAVVASDAGIVGKVVDTQQVAEKYVPGLVLSTAAVAENFGRPSNKWTYKDKSVGIYDTKTPVLTYTSAIKHKDLFTDLAVEGADPAVCTDSAVKHVHATVFVDGATPTSIIIEKASTAAIAASGEGTTLEVYKTAVANNYVIVAINEYVANIPAEPTKANADTGVDRYITLGATGASVAVNAETFTTEDFAKDDVVLATMSNGVVKTVKLAKKVENVAVTAYDDTTVTFNGVPHKYNVKGNSAKTFTMTGGQTYTFYLDSNDNVIDSKVYTETSKDYVMPVAVASTPTGDNVTGAYYNVKYVDMAGQPTVVKVATTAGIGGWSTVKADKDDVNLSVFTTVAAVDTTTAAISATQPKLGSVKTDGSTLFVLQTKADKWVTYTGITNVPEYTTTGAFAVSAVVGTDTYADVVYVSVVGATSGDLAAEEIVFITSTKAAVYVDAANDITYNVYKTIDGTVKTTTTVAFTGLAQINSYDSNGYVNDITAYDFVTPGTTDKYDLMSSVSGTVDFSAPTLDVDGTAYTVASDAVVYMVDSNAVVTKTTVDALDGTAAGDMTIVYKTKDNKTVATIYFVGTVTK